MVAAAAAVLAAGLSLWLLQAVERSRAELRTAVPALRTQADLLEQRAVEFERLRAAPAATVSPTDMRALVQAQAGAAGLAGALVSTESADANHLKVVFSAVAFADWLAWVAALEPHRVHVDACRIEALSTPGLVSITATLVRPHQQ